MKIDFKVDTSSDNAVQASFARIAKELMLNHVLVIGTRQFYLAEIEFYFHSESFPDKYVHKHDLQLESSKWYFHRRGESYRGGNYQGVDLTFGSRAENQFGGILIRALNEVNSENYIYGPSKTVDLIIHITQTSKELIEAEEVFTNHHLSLKKLLQPMNEIVFECPRFGLTPETDPQYFDKPLRFITFCQKEHKDKEKTILPYLIKNYPEELIRDSFARKTLNLK